MTNGGGWADETWFMAMQFGWIGIMFDMNHSSMISSTYYMSIWSYQNNERKLTIMSTLSLAYTFYSSFPQWKWASMEASRIASLILWWYRMHFDILMALIWISFAIRLVEVDGGGAKFVKFDAKNVSHIMKKKKMHNIFAFISFFCFVNCIYLFAPVSFCFNQKFSGFMLTKNECWIIIGQLITFKLVWHCNGKYVGCQQFAGVVSISIMNIISI